MKDIALRPLTEDDFPLLVEWINAPHVAEFWDGKTDLVDVRKKYGPRLEPDTDNHVFVVSLNNNPIGMIQCYRHSDSPAWDSTIGIEKAIGIDYLIGDLDCVGKGLGPIMIRQMAAKALEIYPDCDTIVSVPQERNRASCRALEKAGFTLVDVRKVDSDCPSDAGISSIYALYKND
jgi:aminoglycoside 6'-N-acetyltransferase